MAKRTYANWLGKIDTDAALKDLKNAGSVASALNVVKALMTDVYAGGANVGASDKDELAVVKVLTAFKNQYNINSSALANIINTWDSASDSYKNVKGDIEKRVNNDLKSIESALQGYYNQGGTKIKTTARLSGENTDRAIYKDSKGNYYYLDDNYTKQYFTSQDTVDALDADKGYFVTPASENISTKPGITKPRTNTNTNTNTTGNTTGTTSGSTGGATGGGSGGTTGGSTGAGSYYKPNTSDPSDPILDKIWEVVQQQAEQNKPRTAAELAELYNIDYNEENILKDYNERTNKYYDEAVKEWGELQHDSILANSKTAQLNAQDLFNEYRNAAPTATTKAQLGANALASYMAANYALNESNYAMGQTINNLNSSRAAELEENKSLARTDYNKIGTYLSTLSANLNASDVQQYVDTLKAYDLAYTARRATDASVASGTASKYAGLANAALNTANGQAGTNSFTQLYNYYLAKHNGDEQAASKDMTTNWQWSQTGGK